MYFRAKHFEFVLHGISNLLLQNKTVCPAEGGAGFRTQNSLAKTGETAWACLRHAHSLVGSQPLSSILVLYYSALLEPIFLNRTLTNRTPRVRGGSKLHRTLRFCANSNNSANASQSLGVPPSPHHCSILFCFARDFFEKVWAMGLRAGETPKCIILHSCNTMQVFLL